MSWVDLALLTMLGISVLLGVWRGLVFEVMTIVGWVVAWLAAPFVAPWIEHLLPQDKWSPTMLHALGLVLAFLLVLLVWGLGAKLVRAIIQATPLSIVDRLGGAAFGVVRGLLLALLVAVIVGMTPAARSPSWTDSRLAPWLQGTLVQVKPLLPQALHDYIPIPA
ncbi:membrane protein required for colicin V production [Roseateles sp. YR242]|uniref:CvpA family protein n=1 Tax=Roseateles sp. YR242 TaxID=1855305 RepID=UPI0008D5D710|nr:CvpA family protein [Roseateles sp. YR242]SEL09228.1 membrane protein required for colicin V production [Roseateles sp. YR242]